jgi:hypothetical protein
MNARGFGDARYAACPHNIGQGQAKIDLVAVLERVHQILGRAHWVAQ